MGPEPVRGREADGSFELPILTGKLALDCQHLFIDSLGVRQHCTTLIGQDEAFACALEQRVADILLQRTQTSAHGRLALPELARRCPERALAGDRKKDA